MSFIVAIDGPAGTGKGTMTQLISKRFGFVNIDTGATYRCVTLELLNKEIELTQIDKIKEVLDTIEIEINVVKGKQQVLLNGEDVTEEIRSKRVTQMVSQVSAIKEVRDKLTDIQRKMAQGKECIMEGRDIGTVVFPNADIKIYLDADVQERAKRRYKENKMKKIDMSYEEVLESIKFRDKNDREKEFGALKVAENAIVVDTTNMTINQVEKKLVEIIDEKYKKIKKLKKVYSITPETKTKKILRTIIKETLGFLFRIVFRVKENGKENIPEEGACIICANHITVMDPVGVVLLNKRKVVFVAKIELFKNSFVNYLAHIFDIIPVRRGRQDIESMKRCMKVVNTGGVLGIFPEGTRKGMEKQSKVKNGAAFMAIRTNTPVIPVGIKGDFKPFSKNIYNYGKPIDLSKYKDYEDEKKALNDATKEIMDAIIMLTK